MRNLYSPNHCLPKWLLRGSRRGKGLTLGGGPDETSGRGRGAVVEVSSFLATPIEGRSTGRAVKPAEDTSFDPSALDTGAGVLRLTGEASA
jgi:hypothetical protein